jgi:hypothetical protein
MGVSKPTYDALLQDAAAQVLMLRDLVAEPSDSAIFRHYATAVEKYKDASTLWSEQIDDARYDWLPKGRIVLNNPAIAERYKLATTSHKMPYSGSEYRTVASESIQEIWASAKQQPTLVTSHLCLCCVTLDGRCR